MLGHVSSDGLIKYFLVGFAAGQAATIGKTGVKLQRIPPQRLQSSLYAIVVFRAYRPKRVASGIVG